MMTDWDKVTFVFYSHILVEEKNTEYNKSEQIL